MVKKLLPTLIVLVTALNLCFAAGQADKKISETLAQPAWPTDTVKILVGTQAGANMDVKARLVGKYLSPELGKPVVIVNRPGAGGIVAVTEYLAEPSNTNTLMYFATSYLAVAPLYNKVSFSPADFTMIAGFDRVENGLFASKKSGIKTLDDLKKYGQNRIVKFASGGIGSDTFLMAKVVTEKLGIQSDSISTNGFPDSLVNCASGVVDIIYCALNIAQQYVEEGSIVPIATYTKEPFTGYAKFGYAKVPTLKELGHDFTYSAISYFSIRSGTDKAVVDKIYTALDKVYKNPAFKEELTKAGFVMLPQQDIAYITTEVDKLIGDVKKYAELIKQ